VFNPDKPLSVDSERAVWREVGDEVIVLDTSNATYLTLNASARLLWKRLDDGATPAQLAAELVGAFDLPPEQAEEDVTAFLASLEQLSLLSPGE
jgi:Coenzyme PQQ synthesis protein D (PqqD)